VMMEGLLNTGPSCLYSILLFVSTHSVVPTVQITDLDNRRSTTRAIEDVPRHRARSVSRRRVSGVEVRDPRGSYVDERAVRRSVSRVRY
jgi:hypothetical protein